MTVDRGAAHLLKRVRQTPILFRNFPEVFWVLGTQDTRWRRDEATFRLRNGYVITCPNADGARFPIYEVFADDAYRIEEFTEGIDAKASVLDIGGQIGCFSLALAGAMPDATIDVYEASPTSAGYISRNVAQNGLGDRVTVHGQAMAGTPGEFTFVDSGTASGLNGLTAPDGLGAEVTVPADTFDNAVKAAAGPVQVVKIDVEGAEYDIILNSSPASWSDVRKAVIEYHPVEGHDLDELLAFFAAVGLVPERHDKGLKPGLGVIWLARAAA